MRIDPQRLPEKTGRDEEERPPDAKAGRDPLIEEVAAVVSTNETLRWRIDKLTGRVAELIAQLSEQSGQLDRQGERIRELENQLEAARQGVLDPPGDISRSEHLLAEMSRIMGTGHEVSDEIRGLVRELRGVKAPERQVSHRRTPAATRSYLEGMARVDDPPPLELPEPDSNPAPRVSAAGPAIRGPETPDAVIPRPEAAPPPSQSKSEGPAYTTEGGTHTRESGTPTRRPPVAAASSPPDTAASERSARRETQEPDPFFAPPELRRTDPRGRGETRSRMAEQGGPAAGAGSRSSHPLHPAAWPAAPAGGAYPWISPASPPVPYPWPPPYPAVYGWPPQWAAPQIGYAVPWGYGPPMSHPGYGYMAPPPPYPSSPAPWPGWPAHPPSSGGPTDEDG